MSNDTAFQMAASNIRFGSGTTREIGMDLADMGAKRTLVVIDPALRDRQPGQAVVESLRAEKVPFDVFDEVSVEPTDVSFRRAAEVATAGQYDSFVAVGGGSTIDTAKAANLYATYPADFFDYVNAPIGKGKPVPGPVKPLIAVPTTAGTGSETTGVAIFDWLEKKAKTGIAHRYLKPALGIIDPDNTRSLPAAVAASTGLDVLSHALESFTAIHYTQRPRPARPIERPAYQGNNPISDIWALRALELVNEFLPRAVADASDDEARGQMLLAAAIAGIGFGNAGVHLPHGMSYPVAGMVRDYRPPGYAVDHPLVPHGISVILHTPAVCRFTAETSPARHLRAAAALGAEELRVERGELRVRNTSDEGTLNSQLSTLNSSDAGEVLASRVIHFMREFHVPNGLRAVGYSEADIPALVEGTLPQHRVTKLSPRPAGADELAALFRESMTIW